MKAGLVDCDNHSVGSWISQVKHCCWHPSWDMILFPTSAIICMQQTHYCYRFLTTIWNLALIQPFSATSGSQGFHIKTLCGSETLFHSYILRRSLAEYNIGVCGSPYTRETNKDMSPGKMWAEVWKEEEGDKRRESWYKTRDKSSNDKKGSGLEETIHI